MEPIQYLRALRRRWWVIVAAVLVAGVTAWVTTAVTSPPLAQGTATSFVATTVLWNPGALTIGQGSPITTADSLAKIAALPDVAAIAARRMHSQGGPLALSGQMQASVDATTGYLDITGFGPDAKTAETVSTAFSRALIQYLEELKIKRIDQQKALLLEQISAMKSHGFSLFAMAPLHRALAQLAIDRTTPIPLTTFQQAIAEPNLVQQEGFQPPRSRLSRVLIASLFGLLAGFALALVLERFDTKIRTVQAAEEAFGLPVLAEVPPISRRRRRGVVTASDPASRAADAFRLLGVEIARWTPNGDARGSGNGKPPAPSSPPKTILVTSPEPREGRTMVAANLAAAFAEVGKRVLVLSCDFRRPAVHTLFGVPDRPGLAEVLGAMNGDLDRQARFDLRPYVGHPSISKVAVLPSGATPERPGELLGSVKMQRFVDKVGEIADVVVLDSAPLAVASDIAPLASQVDAVVLVARAGKTRSELSERATHILERLGAKVVGVVLNDSRELAVPFGKRRLYRPTKQLNKRARSTEQPRAQQHAQVSEPEPEPEHEPQQEPEPVSQGDQQRAMWGGLG